MLFLITIVLSIITIQSLVFFLGRKKTDLLSKILSNTSFSVDRAYVPNTIVNKINSSSLNLVYKRYKNRTDEIIQEPIVDIERLGRLRLKALEDGISMTRVAMSLIVLPSSCAVAVNLTL